MSFLKMAKAFNLILVLQFWLGMVVAHATGSAIEQDATRTRVILSDAGHTLILRLYYDGRCTLDQVSVGGRQVVSSYTGVFRAIKTGCQWFVRRAGIPTPKVTATSDTFAVTDICFGAAGRKSPKTGALIERTISLARWRTPAFPAGIFKYVHLARALFGECGVAWSKLFDKPKACYGVHDGTVAFWNRD